MRCAVQDGDPAVLVDPAVAHCLVVGAQRTVLPALPVLARCIPPRCHTCSATCLPRHTVLNCHNALLHVINRWGMSRMFLHTAHAWHKPRKKARRGAHRQKNAQPPRSDTTSKVQPGKSGAGLAAQRSSLSLSVSTRNRRPHPWQTQRAGRQRPQQLVSRQYSELLARTIMCTATWWYVY